MPEPVRILPPGPLQTERLPNGRRRLLRELHLEIDGRRLAIPKGFETDFSSWPSLLPSPPWNETDYAGLGHDALYRWGRWGPKGKKVSRREADLVWYTIARSGTEETRTSWIGANAGYYGLRAFGWITWRRYRSA